MIKLYIDVVGSDKIFGTTLKSRIEAVVNDIEVVVFSDLYSGQSEKDWEKETIQHLDSADIVIPILSAAYFSYTSREINDSFEKIYSSKDRYLFPVMYSPSDWSKFKWVVKSQVLPSSGRFFLFCKEQEKEETLSQLIRNIESVVSTKEQNKSPISEIRLDEFDSKPMVFISHAHEDADFAELLKLRLEQHGILGWIDTDRLKIGQNWREMIDLGIDKSIAVIAVMTNDARESEYVTYEWAFAWGRNKKVLPIMLHQTQLHPRLESLQYLDFTNRDARPWEQLFVEIKKHHLNK